MGALWRSPELQLTGEPQEDELLEPWEDKTGIGHEWSWLKTTLPHAGVVTASSVLAMNEVCHSLCQRPLIRRAWTISKRSPLQQTVRK